MKQVQINTHISRKFNQELENLRNAVLSMGGIVEQQLSDALGAFRDNNRRMAEEVILNDFKVNSMEVQIDEECTRIIATRHPTASDLRLVLVIVKATADIERIGDEVQRIANLIIGDDLPGSESIKNNMIATGDKVMTMLRKTLNAFARLDVDSAFAIHKLDKEIDKQYKALLAEAMTEMQNETDLLPQWLEVLWAMRALERVGDRCKNICEYIIYFVKGRDVRHVSRKKIAEAMRDGTNT
jgi:phosphate transport system protein